MTFGLEWCACYAASESVCKTDNVFDFDMDYTVQGCQFMNWLIIPHQK